MPKQMVRLYCIVKEGWLLLRVGLHGNMLRVSLERGTWSVMRPLFGVLSVYILNRSCGQCSEYICMIVKGFIEIMCVCVCVCVCACMCACMFVCTCMPCVVFMCVHVCPVLWCVCLCVCVYACMLCMHVCVCVCVCTEMCVCVCVCVRVYTHTTLSFVQT